MLTGPDIFPTSYTPSLLPIGDELDGAILIYTINVALT